MPKRRRSTSVLQELFADRQVYVRSGLASRYVALSRSAQISAALGLALVVLWLGLASYAAIAKHLQTVEQARELARLESIAKTLRTTVESQNAPAAARQAEAAPDLVTELKDAKAGRERARTLAQVAAGEAGELRDELALAHDQIRELKCDLTRAETARRAVAEQVAQLESTDGPGAPDGIELTLAGQLMLADPACLPR